MNILSVLGLTKYDSNIHHDQKKGLVGMILGVIYLIVNIYNYGYIFKVIWYTENYVLL